MDKKYIKNTSIDEIMYDTINWSRGREEEEIKERLFQIRILIEKNIKNTSK